MFCFHQAAPNLFHLGSKIKIKFDFNYKVSLCNFIIHPERDLLPTVKRHKLLVLSKHHEYAIIADNPTTRSLKYDWCGCYKCHAIIQNCFILDAKSYCSGCFTALVKSDDKVKFDDGGNSFEITKWIHMTSSTYHEESNFIKYKRVNEISNINNGELIFVKASNSYYNVGGLEEHLFFCEELYGKTVYCFDNIISNV